MTDVLANLREIGAVLFGISFLCVLPTVFVLAMVYQFYIQMNSRRAAERLAKAMGLQQLNEASHFTQVWYGGVSQGQQFAIRPIVRLQRTSATTEGRRYNLSVKLRVAVPVNTSRPEGINLYHVAKKDIPQTFDEAFAGDRVEQVNPAGRTAMLAFIHKIYPKGFTKDLDLRLRSRTRHLQLSDRATAPKELVAEGVLDNATAVLVHDHERPGLSSDDLQQLVGELSAVATALETGRTPAMFANTPIPEPATYEKFILPAMMFMSLVLIPSCICICGVLLVGDG